MMLDATQHFDTPLTAERLGLRAVLAYLRTRLRPRQVSYGCRPRERSGVPVQSRTALALAAPADGMDSSRLLCAKMGA